MDDSNNQTVSSRSVSPEADIHRSSPVTQLPKPVEQFFKTVSQEGFPDAKAKAKAQPWKAHLAGTPAPPSDGKLIVACPKITIFGTNNGG